MLLRMKKLVAIVGDLVESRLWRNRRENVYVHVGSKEETAQEKWRGKKW